MKHSIYRLLVFFASVFVFSTGAREAYASHSMGADLTYRSLGGNQYEVTLSFYRDCAGVPAADTADIHLSSSCIGLDSIFLLPKIPGTGQEILTHCPSAFTTCNDGTFTGIQQYIYRSIITIPGYCADWVLSYGLCCRNEAITNILDPGATEMYIYATLDNSDTLTNNSPTFSNLPVPFACLGQDFCYNHGAYDVDGDSLVFSTITPYHRAGITVNYLAPFTASNPLTSSPAIRFNPATGDICMTPSNLEVTIMAVLVKEYRNGKLIGTVERDIQITVVVCNNQLPELTGIDGSSAFADTICAGSQTCFTIFSSDTDSIQSTFISWDSSIPTATFTVMPGHREKASFCWTPTQADISPTPHCFTVTVHDDNCPEYGSQIYAYCVLVTGIRVDAGPDQTVGCNNSVTFTAVASGGSGNYTYAWNNGDTSASISDGAGTYIVTASDGRCTNSDTVLAVATVSAPTANFSMTQSCMSLAVQFINQSSITGGSIVNWHWNFGDGDTSDLQNPTVHLYSLLGTYTVSLIVRSGSGCVDTVIHFLNLSNDQPVAAFTFDTACFNSPVNFTDLTLSSGLIDKWHWNFGDGKTSTVPSPAHVYSASGNFNVSLVLTNVSGCTDSISHFITVHQLPVASAGFDKVSCEGSPVTLSATGGVTYSWFPGGLDTSTIIIQPISNQVYVVTVTDSNGCSAIDTVKITISRKPFVDAGNDRSICPGASVRLSSFGLSNYTYLWSPGGDTTRQITVSPLATTTYTLIVTNVSGCKDTDQVTVSVGLQSFLDGGPDKSICKGSGAILKATGGTNYIWIPGGTGSTVSVSPAVTTVYMLVDSGMGTCKDTDLVTVFVNPEPAVSFTGPLSMCENSPASFLNTSSISTGGIKTLIWDFGNSTGSGLQNPSVTYQNPGNYQVSLMAISDSGCTDTSMSVISIAPLPNASFNAAGVCFHDTVRFFNNSSISSGEPLNYFWKFGDASVSISFNPDHLYNNSGLFNPSLVVTSLNGCKDSISHSIAVHALPAADAGNPQSVCAGGMITLNATGGKFYQWNPGGVLNSSLQIIPWASQTFTVLVTDSNNCNASDSVHVTVNPNPIAFADTDRVICSGTATVLHGSSILNSSGTGNYLWLPGGMLTKQISVKPATNSTFVLSVTNSFGCKSIDSVDVFVRASPDANAGVDHFICAGSQVTLHGSGGLRYRWDPVALTDSSITVSPAVSTNYLLTAYNSIGCSDTEYVFVEVNPIPDAAFTSPLLACQGNSIHLSNLSSITHGTMSWNWDLGNNLNSVLDTPSVLYADTGSYLIRLIAISDAGCKDTVTSTVTIAPIPVTVFNVNDVCLDQPVVFANQTLIPGNEPLDYHWDFGDMNSSSQISPSHSYSNPGSYQVSLVAVSSRGCSETAARPVTIHPLPSAEFINHSTCEKFSGQFKDASTIPFDAIDSWQWNFGDNSFSTVPNPVHAYSVHGIYPVRLKVVSDFGCPDSISHVQRIHPIPEPDFAGEQKCLGDSIRFHNLTSIASGTVNTWYWNLGDNSYDFAFSPVHLYSKAGSYSVKLSVISDSGCASSVVLPNEVVVYPLPEASFYPNTTEVDEVFPYVRFINESTIPADASWDFGDGAFSTDYSTEHLYPHPGVFEIRLIVMNTYGCRDTAWSSVEVKPVTSLFVPNAFTPNGDGDNDTFHAYFTNKVSVLTQLFDRWGKKIAEWSDLNGSWDGTYNGRPAQADVYVYRLECMDIFGKKEVRIGRVTLVR